ncbi:MAG: signal peptidase I [Acidobacteriia bacterium]|nr:signal peptidase I [Terriglobia bacterium]
MPPGTLDHAAEPAASMAPGPEQANSSVPQQRLPQAGTGWLGSVQSLAGTVVIAVFVITFIVQAFQIPSESMENTLLIGDYLLVDKVHYASGGHWGSLLPYSPIQRGDIIVFRYPVHPAQHFVKRVIATPGDRVRLINKQVWVNGKPVKEKYVLYRSPVRDYYRDDFPDLNYLSANVEARWWLRLRTLVRGGELVVPPDQYFVLGDNRDESLDSRYWGFVPRGNIIGRPLLIYWSFRNPEPYSGPHDEDGKLTRLAYMITHFVQETRWDRAFRVVR